MPPAVAFLTMPSPVGELLLAADGDALAHLRFAPHAPDPAWRRDDAHPTLAAARAQLDAYFAGARTTFDLPLAPSGTPFQQRVWAELRRIPHGATISYGELARRVGDPRASRAVGAANGRNPIAIVVPCHRVIGSAGALTGFGGGIERKRWLLAHEGRPELFG